MVFFIYVSVEPGIDLLASLQLHNSSRQGVTIAPGPQRLRPAFYLQGKFMELIKIDRFITFECGLS